MMSRPTTTPGMRPARKSALMDGDRFTQYQRGTKTGRQPLRDNVQPIRDTRQDVVQPSPQQKAMADLLGTDLALSAGEN